MIQQAEYSDLDEILSLQYLAYRSEAELFGDMTIPPLTQTIDELREEYRKGLVLKLCEDGMITGSVRAYEQDGTAYIGKLMVHPSYRQKGRGSMLLSAIESHFPGKRFELFTSTRSKDNIRLYRKMGYTIFDTRAAGSELIFVYMEKLP